MADTDVGWMHAQGIAGLLTSLPYPVYLGEVTAPDDELEWPYLVAWVPPATRPTTTLAGYGGEVTTTVQITAAALGVREVITALDRVSAALHRQRPDIPGRRPGLITQVPTASPPEPQRDDSVREQGRPVFFSFHQFSLFSAPATS